MPYPIDETHDPKLESWVESANDPNTDFPIQNLPLCYANGDFMGPAFRIGDSLASIGPIAGVAVNHGFASQFRDVGITNAEVAGEGYATLTTAQRSAIRHAVTAMLRKDSPGRSEVSKFYVHSSASFEILPLFSPTETHHPGALCVRDYTDFYASIYHATNVGSMFRPDNPLLPNYKHIPIGYHGRASSIMPSGTPVRRPIGQQAPTEDGGTPNFGPCKMLDYEMEMGAIIARGNTLGDSISMADAEDHILGLCILNDWSARDLQKWEYQPLGPFLAKNFASTVSPYIVTMEALAPFRCPAFERDVKDPQPLPYMDSDANRAAGGFDITLEVHLATKQMRDKGIDPVRISKGNFKDMYWTFAQMVAHHTVNGCNLQPGDLLGSGTVSGTARDARGSLLELTWDGDPFANPPVLVPGTQRTPLKMPTGEERKFLQDGDEVIMKAYCERDGFRRIGFGECRGVIEPARLEMAK